MYRYYRRGDKAFHNIKMVLEADDPRLYRRGPLENYEKMDVSILDELVLKTAEEERQKALRAKKFLEDKEAVKKALGKTMDELHREAREVFIEMNEYFDSGNYKHLSELDLSMSLLTRKEAQLRMAFSPINPWLQNYLNLDMESEEGFLKAVGQITARARITDEEWKKHPIYPVDRPYTKGMKGARAEVDIGPKKKIRAQGRVSRKLPLYVEPAMEITYEAEARYKYFRDVLPKAWLSEIPTTSIQGIESMVG